MGLLNRDFYPTPKAIISKMWDKVKDKDKIRFVLEPSAGKGDIVEYLKNDVYEYRYRKPEIKAIESDDDLFATLLGKNISVIDRDFLSYSGGDIFDLIIMNPPFSEGDKHLMKAIDILYSGQIICLLNAETIKNPYTRNRQELITRLEDLGADIDYLQGSFENAERKTSVEVALISICIEKDIEQDLLEGATDQIEEEAVTLHNKEENTVAIRNTIHNLELEYQIRKQAGLEVIKQFYTYRKKAGPFIELKVGDYDSRSETSRAMQEQVNALNSDLRKHYWRKALDLPEVRERMTSENQKRFWDNLHQHSSLDFTANNVRSFVINLIGSYEQTLIDAAVTLFDDLTYKYSWRSETDNNTLHFSTWKTNKAFKVAPKVIIPCHASYGNPFFDYSNNYKLDYKVKDKLNDIDKVLNYIAGYGDYIGTAETIEQWMEQENAGVAPKHIAESAFFKKIRIFKKGTIHLTFKDENILRKFNVIACQSKGWLPEDYGYKSYDKYSSRDQDVIKSFEGEKSYKKNLSNPPSFAKNDSLLMLEAT
jgi:hypothetical protein